MKIPYFYIVNGIHVLFSIITEAVCQPESQRQVIAKDLEDTEDTGDTRHGGRGMGDKAVWAE